MRLIDVGGGLYNGLMSYDSRFPPVVIEELDLQQGPGPHSHCFRIQMALHSSTYLETSAHLYPERINLDEVPLERCFLNATWLRIHRSTHECITATDITDALAKSAQPLYPGDALVVETGWFRYWNTSVYALDPPFFTTDAIEWMVDRRIGLLGSDSSRWDDRLNPQRHLWKFFDKDILMLACMINLDQVRRDRVKVIVMPMKVQSCAAPCRAIVLEDWEGDWPTVPMRPEAILE